MWDTLIPGFVVAGVGWLIFKRLDRIENILNGTKDDVGRTKTLMEVLEEKCPILRKNEEK